MVGQPTIVVSSFAPPMPAAMPAIADRRHNNRFDQKLEEDVPALCADGHAKPDFFRPLRDRHQENIHDADAADDQRN